MPSQTSAIDSSLGLCDKGTGKLLLRYENAFVVEVKPPDDRLRRSLCMSEFKVMETAKDVFQFHMPCIHFLANDG